MIICSNLVKLVAYIINFRLHASRSSQHQASQMDGWDWILDLILSRHLTKPWIQLRPSSGMDQWVFLSLRSLQRELRYGNHTPFESAHLKFWVEEEEKSH